MAWGRIMKVEDSSSKGTHHRGVSRKHLTDREESPCSVALKIGRGCSDGRTPRVIQNSFMSISVLPVGGKYIKDGDFFAGFVYN